MLQCYARPGDTSRIRAIATATAPPPPLPHLPLLPPPPPPPLHTLSTGPKISDSALDDQESEGNCPAEAYFVSAVRKDV